jgi:hypothetical protein
MQEHSHTAKILTWKLDENFDYKPGSYGCTDCSETFLESPSNGSITVEHKHDSYVHGCFACKIQTLQLSTGDANGSLVENNWTNKKWNNELDLYKQARSQGIQPDGTTTAKVRQAMDVSDKTGHAYGSAL